jgi:ubiquitin C-terminal hydrolase
MNNDEKFHNNSKKYYRHLYLKDLRKEKIINNKNIKNDKLNKIEEIKNNQNDEKEIKEKKEIKTKNDIINKKYLFNESQLTIQLSSFEGESFKPVGLFNPNIYCFMICILQALLSIPELNYYFLSKIYLINNLNKSKNEQNDDNDLAICDAFHDFLKSYLLGKKYIEVPRSLKRICIQLLGGMRMHDCQEFFVCFLEALQEELNNKEKLNIPEKASMEQKWIIYRKVNNSFIDSIFTGLMRSCVQCKKCNFKSYTYDPFIDLSVSINKYKNLEKCLKQYFENEKIDCEYKCDNCKQISKVSINILNFFFLKILHLGHKKIGYYDTTTYFNYTI